MPANQKRVHYYHADSNAVGGHIETPIKQMIAPVAPQSLPPVGGYASSRAEKYHLEGIFSYESASTQVAGSISHKTGGWTTLATAVVEGVNILNVLTAERIVAQIATEHPVDGYVPTVTFVGTQFKKLCISGCEVEPVLDTEVCGPTLEMGMFPKTAVFDDDRFLQKSSSQYYKMNDEKSLPGWVKNRTIPGWVRERYTWDNAQLRQRGAVLCSLVTHVNKEFPGRPFGHVLEIPDIGKVFLGEFLVDHNTFRLIGMRVELGCTTHGSLSFSSPSVEGTGFP